MLQFQLLVDRGFGSVRAPVILQPTAGHSKERIAGRRRKQGARDRQILQLRYESRFGSEK